MKELIRVGVQYASRQQCCKTHKRPLPLPFLPSLLYVIIHLYLFTYVYIRILYVFMFGLFNDAVSSSDYIINKVLN